MGSAKFRPLDSLVAYHTVIVMAVPAEGAMELARMLYFLPSIARVRVNPMIAAFAVEYCRKNRQSERSLGSWSGSRLLDQNFRLRIEE